VTGRTILHYQILEKLGEGGMGVVYKARDTHLDRFVAIKVLPPERVADPERKRRFVQEAKAASALNHPNIVTIYDISSEGGVDFIAMEYVAGKTLDQLVGRKGLKLGETLKCGIQIADALARSHAAGIVHRDLKPSNVMVDEHGLVKVLDFGLAKLAEPTGPEVETVTAGTAEGTILGTLAYMSPEQAEGKPVDARSDIFSFGSVLYEMVTGRRAFQRDSQASTLAAILREEPKPASQVGVEIPRDLEKVITRCLRKQPERRFQHMDDVKVALEELKEESDSGALAATQPSPRRRRRRLTWAAAVLAVLAVISLGVWLLRSKTEAPATALRAVPLTAYPGFEADPSFSPDGNQIAFSWNGEKQDNYDIYVKLIGPGAPLRLTTDPAQDRGPAWSPDGRWIAFVRFPSSGPSAVFLIPALGGPERKLAEGNFYLFEELCSWLAWTRDGRWLVVSDEVRGQEPGGLFLLSAETGERRRLTSVPSMSPALSPDGRRLAFLRFFLGSVRDVYLANLSEDLRPLGEPTRLTFLNQALASPVWTPDGREILFSSGGHFGQRSLWRIAALPGSSARPEPVGEDSALLAVSYSARRLAYVREFWDSDIWRIDLRGPGQPAGPPVRLISSTRNEFNPDYSPDGKRIAFASHRSGSQEIWVSNADGSSPVQLTSSGGPLTDNARWSPDGQSILFNSHAGGPMDLYLISPDGGVPRRLTSGPEVEAEARWSRDGKWIYFASDRTGRLEVWKMPASGGRPVQVTKNGGVAAFESSDGRVLYYAKSIRLPSTLWKVPVDGGEETQVLGAPLSYSLNFVVVEDGIYFVSASGLRAPAVLYFFSFVTSALKPVATIRLWSFGLTISPDRRSILYPQFDQAGSDLMLVENFR
jgi:Tol biopolymer transport system component/predicted Ser/Thr protein kinase